MKDKDSINPGHYTYGKYECIEVLEDILNGVEGVEAFCIGNAIKYLWRYQRKNGTEDLEKAKWYITRAIKIRDAREEAEETEEAEDEDDYQPVEYDWDTPVVDKADGHHCIEGIHFYDGSEMTDYSPVRRYIGKRGAFYSCKDDIPLQICIHGVLADVVEGAGSPFVLPDGDRWTVFAPDAENDDADKE